MNQDIHVFEKSVQKMQKIYLTKKKNKLYN